MGKDLTLRLVAGRKSFALLFPLSILDTDRLLYTGIILPRGLGRRRVRDVDGFRGDGCRPQFGAKLPSRIPAATVR